MYKLVLTRRKNPRFGFDQCSSDDRKVINVKKFPASRTRPLHQNTLRGHGVADWVEGYYDVRIRCYTAEGTEPSYTVIARVDSLYA